jgi:peptide-methionine (S)-S-oxide reductase
MAEEQATLAGGCFWCTEAIYDDVIGISSVESGPGRRDSRRY